MPPRPGTRLIDRVRPAAAAIGYPLSVTLIALIPFVFSMGYQATEREASRIYWDLSRATPGYYSADIDLAQSMLQESQDRSTTKAKISAFIMFAWIVCSIVFRAPIKRYLHIPHPPSKPTAPNNDPPASKDVS